MKRIASLAAAALAAGCVSSAPPPPPPGIDVIVYWTFQHFDYTGTFQPLTCAQAGVDNVTIAFSDGYSETVPCTQAGVDGVRVLSFAPGGYWVTVTGYRNGRVPALYYSGQVNFTKFDGADAVVYADVQGIPGDLTLDPALFNAGVQYPSPACTNALVDYLTYRVRDGAGIVLAQGQVNCVTDPPLITFSGTGGIDLDTLGIRMQAWRTGDVAAVMDSCTVPFNHFGNDTALVDILYPIPSPCP